MSFVVSCSLSRTVRSVGQLCIVLIAICSLAGTASAQTTVTLSAPGTQIDADLSIQGGTYGWTDFSSSDSLESKISSSESYTRRILLKFDTQNNIPANAVIQSAQLYLVLKTAESAENRPLTAYWVNQSFASGQTNWYDYKTGLAWNSPGGDFGSSFGTTFVGGSVGSTYTFDLTKMVQSAVNGQFGSRYTRVGLLDTGGITSGNYRAFYSTRAANSAVRPRLVVTYGGSSSPTTTTSTETLVFLRHGEKPSGGYGQLTCQGLQRAIALPSVLTSRYGNPQYIFAPNPTTMVPDPAGSFYYVRPLATIEPTAIRLGLPVNTQYGYTDIGSLQSTLISSTYASSTVYIAWEHQYLQQVVQNIMNSYGGGVAVPAWSGTDYDSLYVVRLTYANGTITAQFTHDFEGLNNLSTSCP